MPTSGPHGDVHRGRAIRPEPHGVVVEEQQVVATGGGGAGVGAAGVAELAGAGHDAAAAGPAGFGREAAQVGHGVGVGAVVIDDDES